MNRIEMARRVAIADYATDSDGTIQIDDNAEVASVMPAGVWVQAWVFIPEDRLESAMQNEAAFVDK
jgi:hypothetical protein